MSLNTHAFNQMHLNLASWLLSGLVLVAGLFLTHHLWLLAQHDNTKKLNAALVHSADLTSNNILMRFNAIKTIMRGVKGLIDSSENVTSDEFHNYVHALELGKDFGVRGIALVQLLSRAQKSQLLARADSKGLKEFQIKPEGDRPYYAPITMIEPLDADNIKALGLDVLTVPAALSAMELSRDSNDITITSRITLAQDADKKNQFAFVMYLPIYKKNVPLDTLSARRDAIIGWVDVPFRINASHRAIGSG